jgi:hypothetical protein
MKTISLYLAISGLSMLFFFPAQGQLKPSPLAAPITIDGDSQDWPKEEAISDEATGMDYLLAFDEQYVYLLMRSVSPQHWLKIMRNGMEISMESRAGKKKLKGSLVYPYQREGEPFIPPMQVAAGQRPDMAYMRELFLLRNQRFFVNGFSTKIKQSFELMESSQHQMGISLGEDQMVLEFRIAKELMVAESTTNGDEVEVELLITVNGVDQSSSMNDSAPGGGSMGGGMGGGRMGARGGATGRGGLNRPPATESERPQNIQRVDMVNKAVFRTTLKFK